ncbi:MAG: nitroreductase family protein [Bacillota bacterium]
MELKETIARRRSIRKFKPDPVSDEQIREILEAARLAPSGTNRQPWRFLVVKDAGAKANIAANTIGQNFIATAPVIIVCCADLFVYTRDTRKRQEELWDAGVGERDVNLYANLDAPQDESPEGLKKYLNQALLNMGIGIEHMVLTATSLGLGTCWVQMFSPRKMQAALNLPDNIIVNTLLPVGYPDQDPLPRPRVPMEEIVLGVI